MISETIGMVAGRTDPDATTKCSELTEIGFRVVQGLVGRRLVVLGESVLKAKKRLEGVGPKTGIKISTCLLYTSDAADE